MKVYGELGTLDKTWMNTLSYDKIFIVVEYEGDRFMGTMDFDDPRFCREIYALLKSHIGLSLKEIGDLDLPSAA